MRSIYLLLRRRFPLREWETPMRDRFREVALSASEGLARRERLAPDVPNRLEIVDGGEQVVILERPSIVREYSAEELTAIRDLAGDLNEFLAMDYTDEKLARRVLLVVLERVGTGSMFVDGENDEVVSLERFLADES